MEELKKETRNKENNMLDSMQNAGAYIIGKIRSLKAGAAQTLGTNSRAGNGFLILQRRIWETLLCILMMQQSRFLKACASMKAVHIRVDEIEKMTADLKANDWGRSIFLHSDSYTDLTESQMKDWGKMRLSAFGSMAIFFLYGAAGWWHCLGDNCQFNQKDVRSLVMLAHALHQYYYTKGCHALRSPECTPWYDRQLHLLRV
jgi:hypothetical protein